MVTTPLKGKCSLSVILTITSIIEVQCQLFSKNISLCEFKLLIHFVFVLNYFFKRINLL